MTHLFKYYFYTYLFAKFVEMASQSILSKIPLFISNNIIFLA